MCRGGPPIRANRAQFRRFQPQLEPLAEQIVLLGLDGAACRLGISRERLVLALAETRSLDPHASAALKAGLGDAVNRLDREGRLPKVSQLLPEALNQANLPGIVKTIIGAIPDGPRRQRAPNRAVASPDRRRARRRPAPPRASRPASARLGRPVGDPPGRAPPDPRPPAPVAPRDRHAFRGDYSPSEFPHPGGGECTPVMMFQYSTFFDAKPPLTNVTTLVSSSVIMCLPFGL